MGVVKEEGVRAEEPKDEDEAGAMTYLWAANRDDCGRWCTEKKEEEKEEYGEEE